MTTLLAVLAHPDDDVTIGPLLAHYARRGVFVQLVYLTSGQAGINLVGPERGDELGSLREDEARAASRAYGIEEPLFLRAQDGTLPTMAPQDLIGLGQRLSEIVRHLQPEVIITFGPDGYTRHGDHKATCSLVTDLLQNWEEADSPAPRLYYVALPERAAVALAAGGFPTQALARVHERYLTTEIDATDDIEAALAALRCYRSQFAPADMEMLQTLIGATMKRRIALRQALVPVPPAQRERDLFG